MTDGRRVMLVTGTSGDIGSHLARHFLQAGWTVLGLDKHDGEAPLPGLVFTRCDLTDGGLTTATIDALVSTHGAFDALVNCAARIANSPLVSLADGAWTSHDFTLWDEVIASGLTSAFHVTAVTVKHMLNTRKKGVVVNISSICAHGNPGQAAYSAAKAGLNGLTLALAKELGPLGVRVVGLAPGYVDTDSTRGHVTPARLAKVTGAVPLRRLGRVEEVAQAVEFIVANDYLTGTILELDGGLVL